MNRTALLVAALLVSAPLYAAGKTYQVTGPVLEVRDDAIVVEKGKDKWEIARTPATAVKGDLKKGAKVTVEYTMSATKVEVKDEKKK
jgi:cytochrome c1